MLKTEKSKSQRSTKKCVTDNIILLYEAVRKKCHLVLRSTSTIGSCNLIRVESVRLAMVSNSNVDMGSLMLTRTDS